VELDESLDWMDTWRVLEEFHREGRVRHLGVCNVNIAQLDRLVVNARVRPEVLQVFQILKAKL
jgi:diketogulonate reductase-like aldo/keto reductase